MFFREKYGLGGTLIDLYQNFKGLLKDLEDLFSLPAAYEEKIARGGGIGIVVVVVIAAIAAAIPGSYPIPPLDNRLMKNATRTTKKQPKKSNTNNITQTRYLCLFISTPQTSNPLKNCTIAQMNRRSHYHHHYCRENI